MKTIEKYFYKGAYWIIDQYYRLRSYVFRGEYSKKHIIFQKEGSQIKISIKSHDEFVEEKQAKIDNFKKRENEAKYIQFALEQAIDGCNFIIISKGELFVQFWISRGRLDFDFPINTVNGNKKYYYQVIGLLADMDFVRNTFAPSGLTFTDSSKYNKYKVEVVGGLKKITGYFKKRVAQATDFTVIMFKEIYKSRKEEVKIEVG